MPTELNARIGRHWPSPLPGVPVDAVGLHQTGGRARDRWSAFSQPGGTMSERRTVWLSAALLLALWPHGVYVARRLVDGSDEPWGILALATVIALLVRDRALLALPPRSALVASGVLAVVAAVAQRVLPDLAAAAVAMLALGIYLVHALRRPAAPLLVLLLLALPIIASLNFYLGYPLRWLVAHASAALLNLGGWSAQAAGASIVYQGVTVLVDAPCAGVGMLWLGSYSAALLSYLHRASARRTLVNGCVAAGLVLAANVVRNTLLVFPEAGRVDWPTAAHEVIGLAAFVAAIVPLAAFAAWSKP